jgi:outer membrane protein assembly factor BamB
MPDPAPRGRRRWIVIGAGVAATLLVAAATLVAISRPPNVSHPGVPFTAPTTATTTAAPAPSSKPATAFQWPEYGYDTARTRAFTTASGNLRPPLRQVWSSGGNALLEFPPVIDGDHLFLLDDGATVKRIDATTGRPEWITHVGHLAAASPALNSGPGLLYVPILSLHGSSPGGGELAALSMATGRIVWTFPVPAGTESSPLVYGNSVYFGDQAGGVYALNARTGALKWRFQAAGSVKGGLAWSERMVFFGAYSGRVYALEALTGRDVWTVDTSGALSLGGGNFYTTPAVAFGRVYLGSTDGAVYSFAERNGELAWRTGTGAYVYSSPAVVDTPGLGPTVYIGSYDGNLYAFDARSGAVRWRHHDGYRISGSVTYVDGVVYYSDLGAKTTTGLDARTGATVFRFRFGAFTPVIADENAIFLCGYNTLYRFQPVGSGSRTTRSRSAPIRRPGRARRRGPVRGGGHR